MPCSPPSPGDKYSHTTAIADTGASDHYFTDKAPLLHVDTTAPTTTIRTATGEFKTSTGTAVLAIPSLPSIRARSGHIIPGFTNNLLSLRKLCDDDCTAYLDKNILEVKNKQGTTILKGKREPSGAHLWRVNITQPTISPTTTTLTLTKPHSATKPVPTASHVKALDLPGTPALVAFLHAAAGFPVKITWLEAINRGAFR